ncbi:hypothetical protein DFH07DRAFT_277454 [Mycena maculata]|uniref:Uncharacterized protein n=1 Tax=Mycena maculata TaxID=230809 RepID=A0AAD7HM53_9AGAR|nr:hypothetical protein DFH07DRAFT_277454 [Mycena maculata]
MAEKTPKVQSYFTLSCSEVISRVPYDFLWLGPTVQPGPESLPLQPHRRDKRQRCLRCPKAASIQTDPPGAFSFLFRRPHVLRVGDDVRNRRFLAAGAPPPRAQEPRKLKLSTVKVVLLRASNPDFRLYRSCFCHLREIHILPASPTTPPLGPLDARCSPLRCLCSSGSFHLIGSPCDPHTRSTVPHAPSSSLSPFRLSLGMPNAFSCC